MDVGVLVGRILFTLIFTRPTIGPLTKTDAMAAYTQSKRLPQPRLPAVGSRAYILIAAPMSVLGVWANLAALALVAFLLPTAFIFHAFWQVTNSQERSQERSSSRRTSPWPVAH